MIYECDKKDKGIGLFQKQMNKKMINQCSNLVDCILNDFCKWNNLRSLKIIKESDLVVLAECISKLCRLNNDLFKNYELNNMMNHSFEMQNTKFHIKNNVIQCMEFISIIAMQIKHFGLDLKFEDSFPSMVVGDQMRFNQLIITILSFLVQEK